MDLTELNRRAWDRQARDRGPWSEPVSSTVIEKARSGRWSIRLTPNRDVPSDWLPEVADLDILCLAGSGGQQAPILAAAGATVTVLDNSPGQLSLDREVAAANGLALRLDLGDMRDLSRYSDSSFALIIQPIANCFVDSLEGLWLECYRVLRAGGRLLTGFLNPAFFIFDETADRERGELLVRHPLPYSDLQALNAREIERRVDTGDGLTFSHTLESQIGGQLAAGFMLAGLYEDDWSDEATALNRYMPTSLATLAVKPETA